MNYAKTASRMTARLGVALALIGLLGLAGCGDSGPVRYNLSGAVTWGGKPVEAGSITFMPDKSQGNSGPAISVDIKDGQFDTKLSDVGHVGGPHTVKIVGLGAGEAADEFSGSFPVFPPYDTNADLPKEEGTQDFEVPADWVNPAPGSVPVDHGV